MAKNGVADDLVVDALSSEVDADQNFEDLLTQMGTYSATGMMGDVQNQTSIQDTTKTDGYSITSNRHSTSMNQAQSAILPRTTHEPLQGSNVRSKLQPSNRNGKRNNANSDYSQNEVFVTNQVFDTVLYG